VIDFLFYIPVFFISYFGVKIFRDWSLRRRILDLPNERSSHTLPTPRGGGLIIVAVCLIAYSLINFLYGNNFQWSYLLGAVLIAVVSWIDDLSAVSFVWRFLIHSLAALIVILNLGYFDEIYIPFFKNANVGAVGAVLTFFWIVWVTNAYNFMDGIDGIAGTQAVTAGICWLLLGKFYDLPVISLYGGVIAFSSLGFLVHNWQPAKIFMGDVGSAFLGYSFAVFPLLAKNEMNGSENYFSAKALLFDIGILFVWLFVFDTLYTFIRRIMKREKIWQAHRSHIYQQLVIRGHSHQFVSVLYAILSVLTAAILFVLKDYETIFDAALILTIAAQSLGLILYYNYLKSEKSVIQ